MNDINQWIQHFQQISSHSNQMKGGGFTPGYADLIGQSISSALSAKETSPFVKALITITATAIAIVIVLAIVMGVLYLMAMDKKKQIQAEWPEQRCKITIMPIASWVGPPGTSTGQNFKDCMDDFLGKYMEKKFKPLFDLFTKIFGILSELTESIQQVRIMIFTIRNTIMNMAKDVYRKLKDIYYRIAYLVKRVLQIIIYVFLVLRDVFKVLEYTNLTMMSITDFWLFHFCFHPTQIIPTKNIETQQWNYQSQMKDIQLGSIINPSQENQVIGIWKFKENKEKSSAWTHPANNLNWIVSPGHFVLNQQTQQWIQENRKIAFKDNEMLICPWSCSGIVENHVNGDKAMDYWGKSKNEFEVVSLFKAIDRLNKQNQIIFDPQELYQAMIQNRWSSLGVLPHQTLIATKNNQSTPIQNIQIGDELADGSIVVGVCSAYSKDFEWRNVNENKLSSGVWILQNNYIKSSTLYPIANNNVEEFCYTLATTTRQIPLADGIIIKDGLGLFTNIEDRMHDVKVAEEVVN